MHILLSVTLSQNAPNPAWIFPLIGFFYTLKWRTHAPLSSSVTLLKETDFAWTSRWHTVSSDTQSPSLTVTCSLTHSQWHKVLITHTVTCSLTHNQWHTFSNTKSQSHTHIVSDTHSVTQSRSLIHSDTPSDTQSVAHHSVTHSHNHTSC